MANSPSSSAPALTFTFSTQALRCIMRDGEPWFVAADVCDALGVGDTSQAASRLDDDERGTCTIRTPGGQQEMTIINESGLYSLILTSRKPEAKKFKKWVTSEVLPAIRKTGRYIDAGAKAADATPEKLGDLGTWIVQQVHHHTDRYLSRTSHGNAASVRSVVKAHFGCKSSEIPSERLPELLDILEKFSADCYSLHYVCMYLESQLVDGWSNRPCAIPQAIKQLMVLYPAHRGQGTYIQQIRSRAEMALLGNSI